MDAATARLLIAEIAPRVAGLRVTAATSPGKDAILLNLSGETPLTLGAVTMKALPILFLDKGPRSAGAERSEQATPREPHEMAQQLKGATVVSLEPLEPGPGALVRLSHTSQAGRTADRVLAIDLGRRPGITLRESASGGPSSAPPARPAHADEDGDTGRTGAPPAGATVTWWHDRSERLHARLSAGASDEPSEGTKGFASLNEGACFMFAELWPTLDVGRRRAALERALARRRRRMRRAMDKVQAEIDDAGRAEEYRHKGQLILTRQDRFRKGGSVLTVLDYDDVTEVEIEVDPKLGPQQNAESYFRRARKSERRGRRAPLRLGELKEKANELEAIAQTIESASPREIEELERRLLAKQERPRERRPPAERARFRTYRVSGGWEVLVGKSNRDNDVLTHKLARPDDLWFHARQVAGSHVVLRKSGQKAEPDKQAILETAAIAAFHSKAGKSSKVSVCYTEKRHVRKARGGPPGLAVVAREKVVMVRPKLPES